MEDVRTLASTNPASAVAPVLPPSTLSHTLAPANLATMETSVRMVVFNVNNYNIPEARGKFVYFGFAEAACDLDVVAQCLSDAQEFTLLHISDPCDWTDTVCRCLRPTS